MKIMRLLFPYVCPVCLEPVAGGEFTVHEKCRQSRIYVEDPYCMKCGRPIKNEREFCEECEGNELSYDAGRMVFLYHSKMGHSIAEFKNKGFAEVPHFFAEIAVKRHGTFIEAIKAEMIVPVPLSRRKMRVRGFNQTERLARALSERIGIPICNAVEKIKNTPEQKTLSKKERLINLNNAFRVKKGIKVGKSVIVVDDIFTTGSTIEMMALALKKAGAEKVYFICAASAHS